MGTIIRLLNRKCGEVNPIITFLMNLSVIVAVILGFLQLNQSNRSDERLHAIEAVKQTRTVEFLKALTRLTEGFENTNNDSMETFRDDLNYVMNTYDNIAILYLNDIVDKCIIKEAIESGLNNFIDILDSINFPVEYRKNIDLLKSELNRLLCNPKKFKK